MKRNKKTRLWLLATWFVLCAYRVTGRDPKVVKANWVALSCGAVRFSVFSKTKFFIIVLGLEASGGVKDLSVKAPAHDNGLLVGLAN